MYAILYLPNQKYLYRCKYGTSIASLAPAIDVDHVFISSSSRLYLFYSEKDAKKYLLRYLRTVCELWNFADSEHPPVARKANNKYFRGHKVTIEQYWTGDDLIDNDLTSFLYDHSNHRTVVIEQLKHFFAIVKI